jgi:hypothetical protein
MTLEASGCVSLCVCMQDWVGETGERLEILLADATPQMQPIEPHDSSKGDLAPVGSAQTGDGLVRWRMIAEELGALVGGSDYVMVSPVDNANKTSLRRPLLRRTTILQRRQVFIHIKKTPQQPPTCTEPTLWFVHLLYIRACD